MALRGLNIIAMEIKAKYEITAIALVHRLGVVPIGEDSILVVVSAAHRQAAWRAGEEALERCKDDVEVWKLEKFEDGEGVWKSNRGELAPPENEADADADADAEAEAEAEDEDEDEDEDEEE
jgi:molybdopterin synthase catalytic subunit